MKTSFPVIATIALLSVSLVSCEKDTPADSSDINNVSTLYKPVIFELGATWCGSCGMAYPTVHDVVSKNAGRATAILMHASDDIIPQDPQGQGYISGHFNWSALPAMKVNVGSDLNPNTLSSGVDAAITANSQAKAGIGFKYSIDGNTVTVNTKTVFFDKISGTMNLAVYLTEDGIMNSQVNQNGLVPHDHVLQACAGGKGWGAQIASNPEKGDKIDGNYTITIPSTVKNKNNLHVAVVLYKLGSNNYPSEVINSNYY